MTNEVGKQVNLPSIHWSTTTPPTKINPSPAGYITISVGLPNGFYLSERSNCDAATVTDVLEALAKRVLARLQASE